MRASIVEIGDTAGDSSYSRTRTPFMCVVGVVGEPTVRRTGLQGTRCPSRLFPASFVFFIYLHLYFCRQRPIRSMLMRRYIVLLILMRLSRVSYTSCTYA